MTDEVINASPELANPVENLDAPKPSPFEKYLAEVPEPLRPVAQQILEAANKDWQAGATEKFQEAAQFRQFKDAMQVNPRGTIAFLKEQYHIADAPAPAGRQPAQAPVVDAYAEEVTRLKTELRSIRADDPQALDRQVDAIDRLTKLHASQMVAQQVGKLEQAQLALHEKVAYDELKSRYPGVNVDQLWPQIRRHQAQVREAGYVTPDESMGAVLAPHLLAENQRLREQLKRHESAPSRAAGHVAGPGSGAPAGATFDVSKLTSDQILAMLPTREA